MNGGRFYWVLLLDKELYIGNDFLENELVFLRYENSLWLFSE